MRRDTESISQGIAVKLISELRSRGYAATPANTSGKENSWDIMMLELLWFHTIIQEKQFFRAWTI